MVLFLDSGGKGGEVLGAGGLDCGLIDGDNGAVGVGDESGVRSADKQTVSGKVLGTGSLDGGLIDGDNSTVGVGHQTAVGGSVRGSHGSVRGSGVRGGGKVVVGVRVGSVAVVTGVGIGVAVGGKVGGLSSLDLGGLDGGHGSVGVGDELGAGGSHAGEENLESGRKCSSGPCYGFAQLIST
jgi:hypothetical protein